VLFTWTRQLGGITNVTTDLSPASPVQSHRSPRTAPLLLSYWEPWKLPTKMESLLSRPSQVKFREKIASGYEGEDLLHTSLIQEVVTEVRTTALHKGPPPPRKSTSQVRSTCQSHTFVQSQKTPWWSLGKFNPWETKWNPKILSHAKKVLLQDCGGRYYGPFSRVFSSLSMGKGEC
jgi:hypothetical protein